jgi:hypothetical protein
MHYAFGKVSGCVLTYIEYDVHASHSERFRYMHAL